MQSKTDKHGQRSDRRSAFEADGCLDTRSGALGRLAAYRNTDALAAIGDPGKRFGAMDRIAAQVNADAVLLDDLDAGPESCTALLALLRERFPGPH